jgi:hypothetical protein
LAAPMYGDCFLKFASMMSGTSRSIPVRYAGPAYGGCVHHAGPPCVKP